MLARIDLCTVRAAQCCSFSRFSNGRRRGLNYNQIRPNQPAGGRQCRIVSMFPADRHIVGTERIPFRPPFFRQPMHPFGRVSAASWALSSQPEGQEGGGAPRASSEELDFRLRQSGHPLMNSLLRDAS